MLRLLCILPLVISVNSASGRMMDDEGRPIVSIVKYNREHHADMLVSWLAPFIKPCKKGDSACVLASAKAAFPVLVAGLPELGVKPLDPMKLPLVHSEDKGLELTFTDSILTGIKDCSLESVKFDPDKMKQSIAIKCNLSLKGNYKLGGQLLILPVQGEGKYRIDLKDVVIKASGDITSKTDADGKEHWHFAKWKHSYQVKTSAHFDFKNLFNGNKALADPVLEFANTNWKEVMQEVAPPIVHTIVAEAIKALNALYEAVPAEELYIA